MKPKLTRLRMRVTLFLVLLAVTAAAFVLALTLLDDPLANTFIAVGTGLATVAFIGTVAVLSARIGKLK